jgi:hypothetical protein
LIFEKKKEVGQLHEKLKQFVYLQFLRKKHKLSKIDQNSKSDWWPEMALGLPKFDRNVVSTLKNRRKKFYDIWFAFGSQKKNNI